MTTRPKLTRSQRAQVVELLRCAADGLSPTSEGAWTDALEGTDATIAVKEAATMAFSAVVVGRFPRSKSDCYRGRSFYPEAAARVEAGEWP